VNLSNRHPGLRFAPAPQDDGPGRRTPPDESWQPRSGAATL